MNWTTASETNNDYFTIEQSDDGNAWKDIGTVKGVGNSSVARNYSFNTEATGNEVSYFRLKQTDLDARSTYFRIIQVNPCNKNFTGIKIYPNPTDGKSISGSLNMDGQDNYSIDIFDKLGNLTGRYQVHQQTFTISFSRVLSPGIYYARFYSGSFSKVLPFLVNW